MRRLAVVAALALLPACVPPSQLPPEGRESVVRSLARQPRYLRVAVYVAPVLRGRLAGAPLRPARRGAPGPRVSRRHPHHAAPGDAHPFAGHAGLRGRGPVPHRDHRLEPTRHHAPLQPLAARHGGGGREAGGSRPLHREHQRRRRPRRGRAGAHPGRPDRDLRGAPGVGPGCHPGEGARGGNDPGGRGHGLGLPRPHRDGPSGPDRGVALDEQHPEGRPSRTTGWSGSTPGRESRRASEPATGPAAVRGSRRGRARDPFAPVSSAVPAPIGAPVPWSAGRPHLGRPGRHAHGHAEDRPGLELGHEVGLGPHRVAEERGSLSDLGERLLRAGPSRRRAAPCDRPPRRPGRSRRPCAARRAPRRPRARPG